MNTPSSRFRLPLAVLIVVLCTVISLLLVHESIQPGNKSFLIHARRYEYNPPVIHVSKGDTVHIRLATLDVVHGFYLEGHDIDAHIYPSPPHITLRDPVSPDTFREAEEIVFVANKIGKFRYRCSQTCGPLHPFMQGEMIVGPNYPFVGGIGAAVGVLLAGMFLLYRRKRAEHPVVE